MADFFINLFIIVAAICGSLGCIAMFSYFVALKCPKCRQFGALSRTGETQKSGRFPVWEEWQYQCKYCGNVVWKMARDKSG